jgi:hypothetical protein
MLLNALYKRGYKAKTRQASLLYFTLIHCVLDEIQTQNTPRSKSRMLYPLSYTGEDSLTGIHCAAVLTKCNTRLLSASSYTWVGWGKSQEHTIECVHIMPWISRSNTPLLYSTQVGRRVWDDFAEKDKIDREKKKYPAQETLGYRIIGMRVYQPSTDDYVYYDKWYGRSIREDTALQAVTNFFICGEVNRVDVIPAVLGKLQTFLGWFRTQTSLRLFATSLLIVYEGDPAHSDEPAPPVDIRLVDFAHTYEAAPGSEGETDNNTLFGLENFAQCLSVILKNRI